MFSGFKYRKELTYILLMYPYISENKKHKRNSFHMSRDISNMKTKP